MFKAKSSDIKNTSYRGKNKVTIALLTNNSYDINFWDEHVF